jgi:hypothetical protein
VSVRFEDAASVDDLRVPRALFGVYAHTSECLDSRLRRRCRGVSGGNLTLWVGWGAGRMLSYEYEGTWGSWATAPTHVEDSVASEGFGRPAEAGSLVLIQM